MRNPDRIPVLYDLLKEIHLQYPDVRFNQLLNSLQAEYANVNNGHRVELWEREYRIGIVSYRKVSKPDLFNVEDEDFIEFLQEKLDSYQK